MKLTPEELEARLDNLKPTPHGSNKRRPPKKGEPHLRGAYLTKQWVGGSPSDEQDARVTRYRDAFVMLDAKDRGNATYHRKANFPVNAGITNRKLRELRAQFPFDEYADCWGAEY
jgi:hypothetical protein